MKRTVLFIALLTVLTSFTLQVWAWDTESTDDKQAVFNLLDETSNEFKDADLVTVFDRIVTEYADTGAAVTEEEVLLHFRNGESSQDYRALHYDYNPRTANIEFLEVKIYRAETEAVETVPMSSVVIAKAPASSIFWNFDSVICPVPRLLDGDALYYRIKRQGLNLAYLNEITDDDFRFIPPQEGYFMDTLYFQDHHPVIEKTYDITGPRDKPLQFTMANGSIQTTVRFTETQWQYTFSAEMVDPWKGEPFDDGFEETALKLALASHPSWEMKSKWAFEHNEPQFIISDELKAKTDEIIKDCPDDQCKMFRLLHWVAEEVRYLGLDMGEGEGHMVHPTDEIFQELAGVCKDKAAILVSMLRAAGFESYFVMTLAMEQTLDIPADDKFNHGVVAVRHKDGTWTFLDPTWAPQNRPLFNYQEQEQPILIASPEGTDLMHVPYSPPEESPFVVTAETSLNSDGSAELIMFVESDGYVDGRMRSFFNWADVSYQQRFLQSFIEDVAPRGEVVSYEFSHPLDFDQPFQIKLSVTIPDAARVIEDKIFLNPVLTRHIYSSRWESRYLHAASGPATREHGLELACTRRVEFHETITIPRGYTLIELPDDVTIEGDTIDGSFTVKSPKNNRIEVDQVIRIKRRVTPADEYPAVREAVNTLNDIRETILVLEKDGKSLRDPAAPKMKKSVKPHFKPMPINGAVYHQRNVTVTFTENEIIEEFYQEATIFNEDGRDSLADSFYVYNDRFQTIEVLEACTIQPDGDRIDSPETALNETLDENALQATDFSSIKTLCVSQIGVEYGSRLITHVRRTTDRSKAESILNLQSIFSPLENFPVEKSEFIVNVPTSDDLLFESFDISVQPVVETTDNTKTYTWTFENVPTQVREYHQGGYYASTPFITVAFGELNSWDAFAAEIQKILFPVKASDEESIIQAELDKLTGDLLTGREKIQAVFDFVAGACVNVPINGRRHGYILRSPEEILRSGYAYDYEKITLLIAMFERAGGICRIGFGTDVSRFSDSVPVSRLLSETTLAVELENDSGFFNLDGTIVSADQWSKTRSIFIDRQGFSFQKPFSMDVSDNTVNARINLDISDDMTVNGRMDLTWTGLWNPSAEASQGTDHWIKQLAGQYVSEAEIESINVISINKYAGTTRISCQFKGKVDLTSFTDDYQKLFIPFCPKGFSTERYNTTQRKNRTHPLVLNRTIHQNETIRISIPEKWKAVSLPCNTTLTNSCGVFEQTLKVDENIYTLTRTIRLPEEKLDVKSYPDFLTIWDKIQNNECSTVYFKTPQQ